MRPDIFFIKPARHVKIGIVIYFLLKSNLHIKYFIKKLRNVSYKINILKNILHLAYLRILYCGLVNSHFRYARCARGGTYITPLTVMQKQFLKLIYQTERQYNSDALYGETNIF